MEYFVRALGIKQVNTKFERMGYAAVHAEPAMESVATLMMRIFAQIFNSQGRRGGGSWRRDTMEWLERKQRLGLDPRINHASQALRRSLTERGAEHQTLEITPFSVDLGTDLEYAAAVNRVRPFVKFGQRDRLEMRAVVRDYLMAAFKA